MPSNPFGKLLHNSRTLNDSLKHNEAFRVEMELGQLTDYSAMLSTKVNKNIELEQTTQHFLAKKKINVKKIDQDLQRIQSSIIFEPSDIIKTSDIDLYLTNKRKKLLQEHKPKTVSESENISSFIKKSLNDCLEADSAQAELPASKDRIASYADILQELNLKQTRLSPFPLIDRLKLLSNVANTSQTCGRSIDDIWEIISCFACQNANSNPVCSYTSQQLVLAAKSWLEKQYLKTVNNVLFAYATQIKVGGFPSQTQRILAYIRFMYRRSDKTWTEPNLELQKNVPIWLYTYILIRTGQTQLALEFIEAEKDLFHLTPVFPAIFKEYCESTHRLLSEKSQKNVLLEYQLMEYGVEKCDPFKKLVFKILGRCEVRRFTKSNNIEDDLWLQLSLVREYESDTINTSEKYTLYDFQCTVNTIIEKPNKTNVNPWSMFATYLLSLQFKTALKYLKETKMFELEATHFAIAFVYYKFVSVQELL